jgi:hypothetical protein
LFWIFIWPKSNVNKEIDIMIIWPKLLWFSGHYGGEEIKDIGMTKYRHFFYVIRRARDKLQDRKSVKMQHSSSTQDATVTVAFIW